MGANVGIIGTPAAIPRWVRNNPFCSEWSADVADQTGIDEFQDIAVLMT
jgi:hypothetical protein